MSEKPTLLSPKIGYCAGEKVPVVQPRWPFQQNIWIASVSGHVGKPVVCELVPTLGEEGGGGCGAYSADTAGALAAPCRNPPSTMR